MEFHKFKSYAKYGLFLILILSLAGNAHADPKGGIALCWDDVKNIDPCYQNLEMFENYNATCTININSNDLSVFGQDTKNNLSALHVAGWEVAAHGRNHEDSIAFLNNHTRDEWMDQEIFPEIVELTGYDYPISFAYPYGSNNETTDALLAPYFRTIRSTAWVQTGNVNETVDAYYNWDNKQVLYGVEIDDQANISLESIQYGINRAVEEGSVVVLYGHELTSNVTGPYQTSTARLEEILSYTSQKGGKFYHMGDLGNSSWVRPARFSNVTANFTVSKNILFAGGNVTFVDYSVNQTSETFNFGDGSPVSDTANVVHIYATPGTYTANLTVTNDVSSQSVTRTITVLQPAAPAANFTSNLTTGFAPLNVAFTDTSTALPASWSWDFGDGTNSTEQNPKHTYSTPGSYAVNLTVENEFGNSSKTATITVLKKEIIFPTVAFNTNVTEGYAPLSVLFTDVSQNAESRSWDVNNDGVEDSKEQSFVYKYAYPGTYTAKLTVSNENGTDSKTVQIFVRRSGGGSSSGGGGGSPEPAKNIEVKEISQTFITNGKPVRFEFAKNATCVVCVSFDAKKTVGKTTTIAEQLKNKSTLASGLPEEEVYKYFNIWVGNSGYASSNNIENRALCFKVEKAWIKDKKIDQDSIALNRYSDKKWEQFPATLLKEDSKYLYFKSSVSGYSFFAITGNTTATESETKVNQSGNVISPETQDEQNNTKSEVNQTSVVRRTRAPGFEMIYCILGLLAVFLHRRR